MNDIEEWLPVTDFEGRYEVSNHGNVRSLTRRIPVLGRPGVEEYYRLQRGKDLRPVLTNGIHWHVGLYGGRGRQAKRIRPIHQLVLEAFVGPRPHPDWHACHNDGDPLNNHWSNLRWDTPSGNMQDKHRHGTCWESNKTHCAQGHEYSAENTWVRRGKRVCRSCDRERQRVRHALKRHSIA